MLGTSADLSTPGKGTTLLAGTRSQLPPHVSSDDHVAISIWYNTNAPAGTVSGFDPDNLTLVMLHGVAPQSDP